MLKLFQKIQSQSVLNYKFTLSRPALRFRKQLLRTRVSKMHSSMRTRTCKQRCRDSERLSSKKRSNISILLIVLKVRKWTLSHSWRRKRWIRCSSTKQWLLKETLKLKVSLSLLYKQQRIVQHETILQLQAKVFEQEQIIRLNADIAD